MLLIRDICMQKSFFDIIIVIFIIDIFVLGLEIFIIRFE